MADPDSKRLRRNRQDELDKAFVYAAVAESEQANQHAYLGQPDLDPPSHDLR